MPPRRASGVSLGVHIADVLGRPVAGIPPCQSLSILEEIRHTVAGTAARGLVIQWLGSNAGIKDLAGTLESMKTAKKKPRSES